MGKKLRYNFRALCTLALLGLVVGMDGVAQTTSKQNPSNPAMISKPPVVEGVPASPMTPPSAPPVVESSVQSSPAADVQHGLYVPAKTPITVRLKTSVDSAKARNDDALQATLITPVKLANGHTLPAGTSVRVKVLAAAAAGTMQSAGELTLQVTYVGTVRVHTDVKTFSGQEGHKDIADSAPAKGTEASVTAGATLRFMVPAVPR